MFFRQGAAAPGDGALRTGRDLQALRAAAARAPVPAGRLQVDTALGMLAALQARLDVRRHRLLAAARGLTGARVLAGRLSGAGPVTGLAMTCWRGGAGRFSSARQAVRFAGLDVTVRSSDRKGPPGRPSRPGPPVLRRAVEEAGQTHARAPAPGHRYDAAVKDRPDGKRAALSEARQILRQACHILAEPGDDAPAAARARPVRHGGHRGAAGRAASRAGLTGGGRTAASCRRPAVSRSRPCRAGPGGRPEDTERPHPPQAAGHPLDPLAAGRGTRPRAQVSLAAPSPPPPSRPGARSPPHKKVTSPTRRTTPATRNSPPARRTRPLSRDREPTQLPPDSATTDQGSRDRQASASS